MVILTTFLSLTISEIQQVVSKLKGRADLEERKLESQRKIQESRQYILITYVGHMSEPKLRCSD
jgi:hypothetical protein